MAASLNGGDSESSCQALHGGPCRAPGRAHQLDPWSNIIPHAESCLSRLECDLAAPRRSADRDACSLGADRQSVLGSCRGSRGSPAGRGSPRHARGSRRCIAEERRLHLSRNRGQCVGAVARSAGGVRRPRRAPVGLGRRACLGAVGRPIPTGEGQPDPGHTRRRDRPRPSAGFAR